MRTLLLAGSSLLALSASVASASATTTPFHDTGALQYYTVPTTGTYDIVAIGAQGGSGGVVGGRRGYGARLQGNVGLT